MLLLFVVCGVFADVLAPYGYNEIHLPDRSRRRRGSIPFGTDNLGRDVLSRCLHGAQLSVIIGLSAAALATVISALIGMRQRLPAAGASTSSCSASSTPGWLSPTWSS